jgi:hypothetical protein
MSLQQAMALRAGHPARQVGVRVGGDGNGDEKVSVWETSGRGHRDTSVDMARQTKLTT